MRAAHKHNVRRVVITSSEASVLKRKVANRKATYTE
jgi:hypothetical protein